MSTLQHFDTATAPAHRDRSVWTATGLEPQVFLDRSGRRAVRVRLGGAIAALAAAGWLGVLLSGAAGFSTLPPVPISLAARAPAHVLVSPHCHGILRVAFAERPVGRG